MTYPSPYQGNQLTQLPITDTASPSARVIIIDQGVKQYDASKFGGVPSVFGRGGAVTAQSGDYKYSQISGTPTLGTAAAKDIGYFDIAGAASIAQSNAELYASNASNLSSGTVSGTLIPTLNQDTTGKAGTVSTISDLIIAGTNVSITGSGTLIDPYTITASGGVSSFNTLTGDVTITAGTNITFTSSGNNTQIDATGGGVVFPSYSSDPSSQPAGTAWYNSTADEVRVQLAYGIWKLAVSPIS